MNLLTETVAKMREKGYDAENIVAIFDNERQCCWEEFVKAANRNYPDGYGRAEVNKGLVILFKDGSWLERAEYDGAEWWEYKKTPTPPAGNGFRLELFEAI